MTISTNGVTHGVRPKIVKSRIRSQKSIDFRVKKISQRKKELEQDNKLLVRTG